MKISVIIPSYNRAPLVTATLESVLSQTRPPEEIIVVDDGSTDDTRAVIAAYAAANGGRVRYHLQKNAGPSAARNTGLALTDGDAVCMLDSDDRLHPAALERLEAALEAGPTVAVAYSSAGMMDADGVSLGPWKPGKGYHAGDVWEDLLRGNFIRSPGAALVRRALLEQAGRWDEALRLNEDWYLWVRLAELGPFAHVDEPLFFYRVHAAAASSGIWAMHRATLRMYDLLRRRYQGERARALEAVRREVRAAQPLYLLALARHDLRRGRPGAALAKAVQALWMRPQYLLDRRLARRVSQEARRILAGRAGRGAESL
ncbi:MAG: glycosyltransferase family 2 protein [Armatimonadetes bacterium]|nr:glycosyltransferase family 2 protein [Armatimonadota bacterium]